MDEGLQFTLVASACVLAYAIAVNRLRNLVQPAREALARDGEKLLFNKALSPSRERSLKYMLDNCYNPWLTMFLACALPVHMALAASKKGKRSYFMRTQDDKSASRVIAGICLCGLVTQPFTMVIFLVLGLTALVFAAILGLKVTVIARLSDNLGDNDLIGRLARQRA